VPAGVTPELAHNAPLWGGLLILLSLFTPFDNRQWSAHGSIDLENPGRKAVIAYAFSVPNHTGTDVIQTGE
jgi:hypothetical protein